MKKINALIILSLFVLVAVRVYIPYSGGSIKKVKTYEQFRIDSIQGEFDSLKVSSDVYYVRMVNLYEYRIKKEKDRVEALIGRPNFNR